MRTYKKNQIRKPHDEKIRRGLDEEEGKDTYCKECQAKLKKSEDEVCNGCKRAHGL